MPLSRRASGAALARSWVGRAPSQGRHDVAERASWARYRHRRGRGERVPMGGGAGGQLHAAAAPEGRLVAVHVARGSKK